MLGCFTQILVKYVQTQMLGNLPFASCLAYVGYLPIYSLVISLGL